jgi:hypothetical protein
MRLVLLAVVVPGLMAVGCADPCTALANTTATYNQRAAKCSDLSGASFHQGTCRDAVKGCSSDDQTILDNYVSCIDGLPACTASSETVFVGDATACVTYLDSLSSTCRADSIGLTPGGG